MNIVYIGNKDFPCHSCLPRSTVAAGTVVAAHTAVVVGHKAVAAAHIAKVGHTVAAHTAAVVGYNTVVHQRAAASGKDLRTSFTSFNSSYALRTRVRHQYNIYPGSQIEKNDS